ncbi:hypothetical protein ABZ319_00450 [Nocardia sp. NPDC005978]|uniref:hypothetical protein n=1 Tax=Nocardia sp. NPDC005978 TaxID=3156725 RepID=UPI0033B38483
MALNTLITMARLNPNSLSQKVTAVGRSTIYSWFQGTRLPQNEDEFLVVVHYCQARIREQRLTQPEPTDDRGWRQLLRDARMSERLGGFDELSNEQAHGRHGHGRTMSEWDPVTLGVHKAIGGVVPSYIPRDHDVVLRAVLDPTVTKNRLVVLRGGSSTGKSYSAYRAVLELLTDWTVIYPPTPAMLKRLVEADLEPRTVIWLNELSEFTAPVGGTTALEAIVDILERVGSSSVFVITSVWPERWKKYLEGSGGNDPTYAVLRRLLIPLPELANRSVRSIDPASGGVVDVAEYFSAAEMSRACESSDPILQAAVESISPGDRAQIAQYLAGVPDLLEHFEGPGADPYGRAVIRAAVDIARFHETVTLSLDFLSEAAVGYLDDRERALAPDNWNDCAIDYATTELKGAVRALEPVPPERGIGIVGYRLTDYLDQHSGSAVWGNSPPAEFWYAALEHFDVKALNRLGNQAVQKDLLRIGGQFWKKGISGGDGSSALNLFELMLLIHPDDTTPHEWIAGQIPADGWAIDVLERFWQTGSHVAFDSLAIRLARHLPSTEARAVPALLNILVNAGAAVPIGVVLRHDLVGIVSLEDLHLIPFFELGGVPALGEFLDDLCRIGAAEQSAAIAYRLAREVSFEKPYDVARVIDLLWDRNRDAIAELLRRNPAKNILAAGSHGSAELLVSLYRIGAGSQVSEFASRVSTEIDLRDSDLVFSALRSLHVTASFECIAVLLSRSPADKVSLQFPYNSFDLLRFLAEFHSYDTPGDQFAILSERIVAETSMNDPGIVASVLAELRELQAFGLFEKFLDRDPIDHVSIEDAQGIAELLMELLTARKHDEIEECCRRSIVNLVQRNPAMNCSLGGLDNPRETLSLLFRSLIMANSDVSVLSDRITAHKFRDGNPLGQMAAYVDNLSRQSSVDFSTLVYSGYVRRDNELGIVWVGHWSNWLWGCEPDRSNSSEWSWSDL